MKLEQEICYMNMAKNIATLSPDSQTKVGCILVNSNGRQIASSYNNFVDNSDHSILPNSRPEKYEFIQHAEMNLLFNCLKNGLSAINNSTVFCTLSPCLQCLRAMFQSGITKVYYDAMYFKNTDIYNIPDMHVKVSYSQSGFSVLELKPIQENKIEST